MLINRVCRKTAGAELDAKGQRDMSDLVSLSLQGERATPRQAGGGGRCEDLRLCCNYVTGNKTPTGLEGTAVSSTPEVLWQYMSFSLPTAVGLKTY